MSALNGVASCLCWMLVLLPQVPKDLPDRERRGIEELVREAQLIFEGVVINRQYRTSDQRSKGDAALPHTFVTLRVESVLKGTTAENKTITLRFLGGPSGRKILKVEGIPLFDVGEKVVLLVSGNGSRNCPLVGCAQGRFRVIGELVYDNAGAEVWLRPDSTLEYGPVHPLEEVIVDSVAGRAFTRKRLEPVSKQPRKLTDRPRIGTRLDAQGLSRLISETVRRIHTDAELKALEPVRSARVDQPFYIRAPKPAKPPREERE